MPPENPGRFGVVGLLGREEPGRMLLPPLLRRLKDGDGVEPPPRPSATSDDRDLLFRIFSAAPTLPPSTGRPLFLPAVMEPRGDERVEGAVVREVADDGRFARLVTEEGERAVEAGEDGIRPSVLRLRLTLPSRPMILPSLLSTRDLPRAPTFARFDLTAGALAVEEGVFFFFLMEPATGRCSLVMLPVLARGGFRTGDVGDDDLEVAIISPRGDMPCSSPSVLPGECGENSGYCEYVGYDEELDRGALVWRPPSLGTSPRTKVLFPAA
jgi:hypothetical protein